MKKKYYNVIGLHKIGGLIPAALKYWNVSENKLLHTIQYWCENYHIDKIFIYDAETKKLAGWYRPEPPQQGLTWKNQTDGNSKSFINH